MISLIGVTVRRDGQALLDGVDLQVRPGELVLVGGGRGAGKSTLLRVAAALTPPDSGEVWLAGRNVTALRPESLPFVRRNIGFLPSDAALLPRASAVENVMLALAVHGRRPGAARHEALRTLEYLGAGPLAGRETESLSAGERRLVALARALVTTPPLLVLDEPTAMLASDDAAVVLGAMLASVRNGTALLCASADLMLSHAAAEVEGRLVTLHKGRLDSSADPGHSHPSPPEGAADRAATPSLTAASPSGACGPVPPRTPAGSGDGVPVCALDYAPTALLSGVENGSEPVEVRPSQILDVELLAGEPREGEPTMSALEREALAGGSGPGGSGPDDSGPISQQHGDLDLTPIFSLQTALAEPPSLQAPALSEPLPIEIELAPVETMASEPLLVEVSLQDEFDDEALDETPHFELAAVRERGLR